MPNNSVILNGFRTPIGEYGGKLKEVSAGKLLSYTLKENLNNTSVKNNDIEEVIAGNVGNNPKEYNVARIGAQYAGIPDGIPAYTVNRLCGSGMQSILSAHESIISGRNNVVLAGGTENMSKYRYALNKQDLNFKLGNKVLIDSLEETLTDPILKMRTTELAELWAEEFNISKNEIDEFAFESFEKAKVARRNNRFSEEIVKIKTKKDFIEKDEISKEGVTLEEIKSLNPIVKKNGRITAGNSSKISDGAASVLIMEENEAKKYNNKSLIRIKGIEVSACNPKYFGLAPVRAVQDVLKKLDMSLDDIKLIEINEAFAAQCLLVENKLNINRDKINVNGGAISLGHPLGCSGTRIVVTLIHEMKKRNVKYGLACLCIGGGQGMAIVLEKV